MTSQGQEEQSVQVFPLTNWEKKPRMIEREIFQDKSDLL